MKLTAKDSNVAVVDEVFSEEIFKSFWQYFNSLDFAYRSMSGWSKVWRINDGQILAGAPYYHNQAPFNNMMDIIDQSVYGLAKQHLESIVGKEGEDWHDILYTPYIYPSGTKISWHDDQGYSGACIFYPHQIWNPHWGGELMVAKTPTEEERRNMQVKPVESEMMTRNYVGQLLDIYGMGMYVSPLPNRMVFTSGSTWHAINRVDQAAGDNVRCSIVAFFLKEKRF
jgi:hypothetical protein